MLHHYKMFLKIFVLLLVTIVAAAQDVTLQINEGLINGRHMTSKNGKEFSGFIGIPYAEAPVGRLRFQPPVPKTSWIGTRQSLEELNICPQIDILVNQTLIQGEEDCLYLNVFTPKLSNDSDCNSLPVMFFIHGGAYMFGHANLYKPDILLDRDLVLVVINYRLGPLGFLTTGDMVVPGNNGLKDQNLALKWTKKNVRAFGGDPNRITIFGESAGAASVHMHMLSPLSKGAISESGTALGLWSFASRNEAVKLCKNFAETFGCPSSNSTEMIDCLRQQNAYDFVKNAALFVKFLNDPPLIFKAVAEDEHPGAFLTQHPLKYIKSGKVARVPWITGINADEGAYQTSIFLANSTLLDQFKEKVTSIIPSTFQYEKLIADVDDTTRKVNNYYFRDGISSNTGRNITNLYTDGWFLAGVDASIRMHLEYVKQPIYFYLFSYRGRHSFTQLIGNPHVNYGVCHLDELFYLFPLADVLFTTNSSDTDKEMTDVLTSFWYNFARLGKPTIKSSPIEWDKVISNDTMEYLDIGGPYDLKKNAGLYMERTKLWRLIMDEALNSVQ